MLEFDFNELGKKKKTQTNDFILGWDATTSGMEGNSLLMTATLYKNQHRTWEN